MQNLLNITTKKNRKSNYFFMCLISLFAFCYQAKTVAYTVVPFNKHKLLSGGNIINQLLDVDVNKNTAVTNPSCNYQNNESLPISLHNGELKIAIAAGKFFNDKPSGDKFNLELRYDTATNHSSTLLNFSNRWSYNLSHFYRKNKTSVLGQLLTSRGQCFNAISGNYYGAKWVPCSKNQPGASKIKVVGSIYKRIYITYPDGTKEVLNRDGFETQMIQPDKNNIWFSYSDLGFLHYIHDDAGHQISLRLPGGGRELLITGYDNKKPVQQKRFYLYKKQGVYPQVIILSDQNKYPNLRISMDYDEQGCLSLIRYSTGLTEVIRYKYGLNCQASSIRFAKPGCASQVIH
ncbi:MAG: hypothetical protein OXD32_00765 [Endozoicomonadaceae bacterium]|nr:hypothetical protein [Endozoicomonadaceae bacterium]